MEGYSGVYQKTRKKQQTMRAYSKGNLLKMKIKVISYFSLLLIISSLISCGGSKNTTEEDNFEKLKNMVHYQRFEIENQWANPLRGNMIDLIGNPNYIRFSKDSVDIYLPYFGERQAGGGYGSRQGGIIYEGVPKDLTIKEDEKEKNIMLRFSGQRGTEDLRFFIILYPDGNTNTSVNSSQRDAISYRGDFSVLPEKQKRQVDVLLDRNN